MTWTTPTTTGTFTARRGLSATTIGNRIYTLGGYVTARIYLSTIEVFDPATGEWTTPTTTGTSAERYAHVALLVDNVLYAITGQNSTAVAVPLHDAFTPATSGVDDGDDASSMELDLSMLESDSATN